ncbi:MAG: NDP-sugar synthase [Bacillota bacterium]
MKCIILAGGKGTRLRPLTYAGPKGLVPLVNKAFLEYQVELLRAHGIHHIILSVNYLADEFCRHFQDGAAWGVSIEYARERVPLGTAGAIKNCEPYLDKDRVLVLNGDVLTDIDLHALVAEHESKGSLVTIATTVVDNPTAYGLVVTDPAGCVTAFLEKPGWDEVAAAANTINAGIYVLEPSVVARLPAGREVSFERDIVPALLAEKAAVRAFVTRCYWLDIGTLRNYLRAHMDILDGRIDVVVPGRKAARAISCGKNVQAHRTARLTGPIAIGNHVSIHARAEIGPWAVLGDGCTVGENTHVSESVVHDGATVGKGSRLHRCIIASNAKVGDVCYLESMVVAPASVVGQGTRVDIELSALSAN